MKHLHTKALWLFFFRTPIFYFSVIMFLFGLFILFIEAIFDFIVIITIIAVGSFGMSFIFLIVSFIWAQFLYNNYRYSLTELAFRKELGVITKLYVTIPYDTIQNIDITRSFLERILGLSTILIQNAGHSGMVGAEGRLPGISHAEAENLRAALLEHARHHAHSHQRL